MLLAIDLGNTQTHIGMFRDQELVENWRLATVRETTGDELATLLVSLLELRDLRLRDVDEVILSSVVPQLTLLSILPDGTVGNKESFPMSEIHRMAAFGDSGDGYSRIIVSSESGEIDQVRAFGGRFIDVPKLARFEGASWLAAYYDPMDGLNHVIVATDSGKIHQIWFPGSN